MSEMGNVTPIASSLHHYRLSWITTSRSSRAVHFCGADGIHRCFGDSLENLWTPLRTLKDGGFMITVLGATRPSADRRNEFQEATPI
jgi:hypothetical protein